MCFVIRPGSELPGPRVTLYPRWYVYVLVNRLLRVARWFVCRANPWVHVGQSLCMHLSFCTFPSLLGGCILEWYTNVRPPVGHTPCSVPVYSQNWAIICPFCRMAKVTVVTTVIRDIGLLNSGSAQKLG